MEDAKEQVIYVSSYQPLTEEQFSALERAIIASKGRPSTKQLGRLTKASSLTNAQLKDTLKRAQIAYNNQEWITCAQYLGQVIANEVGPVSVKGRFAVAAAYFGAWDDATRYAKECYEADPAEPSSYRAMAVSLARRGLFKHALRWFKLFELANGPLQDSHLKLISRIEADQRYSTLPLICKPLRC
jgi:hypothetical protein